jgi:serine/threonine-protein kinase RsbW
MNDRHPGTSTGMATLRATHPPAAAVPVQRWVLDDYTQLTLMRSSLQQTLDVHVPQPSREREEIVESMALVATELATNALSHAGSPTVVQLLRAKTSFILDVADDEPTKAPEVVTDRLPGQGGLGLDLTQRLAHDAGWYTTAHTKHIWAQFVIPRRRWSTPQPRISVPGLHAFIQSLRRRRGDL